MLVMHAMTPNVISISPDATVTDAIKIILKNRISGLPVVDESEYLVGIVSEGDFLHRVELGTERKRSRWLSFLLGPSTLANEYVHSHSRKIKEIMTPDPVTVTESTSLDEVARLMERHQIKRLPVVRGKKVVGMITRKNLIQIMATRGHAIPPLTDDDQSIRSRILNEIAKQPWAVSSPLINLTVHNGIVELFGAVNDERTEKALIVLAENTKGVKAVKNGVVFLNPTGMVFD
jgi:CBS domain-containing protein